MEKTTLGTRRSNIFLLFLVLSIMVFLSALLGYILAYQALDNILTDGIIALLLFGIMLLVIGLIEIKTDIIELKRQGRW